MNPAPPCPACKKTDRVAKVSAIYIEGTRRSRQRITTDNEGNAPDETLPRYYQNLPDNALAALSRRLKPPESGKTQVVRLIHPDLAVLAFSLAAPLFLTRIYQSQPGTTLPILMMLAIFYGLYFWKRKPLILRFQHQQERQRQARQRVGQAVRIWMKFYYCPCQDGIFEPGAKTVVPVDQMASCLYNDP